MALPTNSAGPDAPTDSTAIDGTLGLGNDDQEIRNWIAALSPSGASAYDTGWVNCTMISPYVAQGGNVPQVRRIGKVVYMRRGVASTGMAAAGGYNAVQIPTGFWPAVDTKYLTVASNVAANVGEALVSPAGVLTIRTNTTLGNYYMCDSLTWLVD